MCSPATLLASRVLAVVAGVSLAFCPGAAGAQRADAAVHTAQPPRDARMARMERLEARRVALDRDLEASRRLRTRTLYPDTLRVGIFRVATSPELRPLVEPVARQLSRELQPRLDGPSRDSLLNWVVSVRRLHPDERRYFGPVPYLISVGRGNDLWGGLTGDGFMRPEAMRSSLEALVSSAATASFDAALRAWIYNGPVSPIAPNATVERDARLELAVAESHPARRCVSGDLRQCAAILALRGRPADPLHQWYAPPDYQALVSRIRLAPGDGRVAPTLQRRCLAAELAACERLLTSLAPDRIPPPVMEGPRLMLLREALELGGNGALGRLRPSTADVGARLAAASGVSEDSLLASWRRRMVAPRGANVRPPAGVAIASAAWMVALAGVAMRRTRRCS